MAAGVAEKRFGFPRRFLEVFFALSTPREFRSNSKGNNNNNNKKKNQFLSYSVV